MVNVKLLLCSSPRNARLTQNPKHGVLSWRAIDRHKRTTVLAAGQPTGTSKQSLSAVCREMSARCERHDDQTGGWESRVKLLRSFEGDVS